MDTAQALQAILANTYTKADCYRRFALLEDFLNQVRFGGDAAAGWAAQLSARYGAGEEKETALAVAAWEESLRPFFAAGDLGAKLQALKRGIDALPEMVLYVPMPLAPASLANIGAWCRAQVDASVLLDIKIDPGVLGGCAFVWKSVLHDFSLRYFLQKHRQEVEELVASTVSRV